MNNQFLKTFKQINGSKEMEVFHQIKNNKVIPVIVTDKEKEYVRKYLLKSEYIESTSENTIIVATNNSRYTISFYNKFITLFKSMNCYNMNKTRLNQRYVKYLESDTEIA